MLPIMNTDTKIDRLDPTRGNPIVQSWAQHPTVIYVTRTASGRLRAIGSSGRPMDAIGGYLSLQSAMPHNRYIGTEPVEAMYVYPGDGQPPKYHGPDIMGALTAPLWVVK